MAIRLRKVARRAWLITLATLASLVLILASGLVFLIGTETGRLTLLAQAERWLPVLTGQTLTLDNPQWATLDHLDFDRLVYRVGEDGLGVTVESGTFRWQPQFSWQRRIWVDALTADRVRVDVPAATGADTPPEAASEGDPLGRLQAIWNNIPPIQLAQLSIADFELALPGRPVLRTGIEADAEINWGSWPARLSLALTEGDDQAVTASVTVDAVDSLSLRGNLNAAAEGSWANWIDWPLNEPLVGNWDLRLSQVGSQWRADIEQLELPWRQHRLGITGQVSYSPADTRFYLSPLNADVDGQQARFGGFVGPRQADLDIDADALPLALLNDLIPVSDLSGNVSVAGHFSGGWQQPQYDGSISLDGTLRGDPLTVSTQSQATLGGVELETARVQWGDARLTAGGSVQWDAQELDLNVSWQGLDQSRWQPWVEAWPADLALTTEGEGSLTGSFASPQFEGRIETTGEYRQEAFKLTTGLSASREQLELRDLALATEAGDIEANARLQLDGLQLEATTELFDIRSSWLAVMGVELPVQQNWGLSGQLAWRGTATEPVAEGNLSIEGQWQNQALNVALQIDRFDLSQVTLGESRLQLADTDTEVSGVVDWQQQTLDLSARVQSLRLNTVRPFLPALPDLLADLRGNVTGELSASGPWTEPAVNADLAFDGRWLEQSLNVQARVSADNRERWQIRQASLNWSELGVSFTGEVQPFASQIAGDYQISNLTLTDVRRLPLALPETLDSLSGRADASGRIEGDLMAPTLTSDLEFNGNFQDTPLTLNLSASELTPERLRLTSLQLQSGESQIEASGQVDFAPLALDLDTELTNLDWNQVTPWIPDNTDLPLDTLSGQSSAQLGIEGTWPELVVEGQVQSSGEYLNDGYDLDWQGRGTLGGRLQQDVRLTWGDALLEGKLDYQDEQVSGEATLSRVSLARLRALGLPITSDLTGEINGQASIDGAITDPEVEVRLNAGGDWSGFFVDGSGSERWSVTLVAAGRLDQWQINEARADLGPGGTVSISGSGTSRSVDLRAEVSIPQTERWLGNNSTWAGGLEGSLQVSGTPEEPSIAADLDWDSSRWPLDVQVDVSTADNQHRLLMLLRENGADRLRLNLGTEQTSLAGWAEPLEQRPFTADAELAVNATVLEPLLRNRPDQDFTGDIDGRLSVNGTLERPEWEGSINLSEGRYENASTGTVLADMNAQLTANNRTLQFNMAANDTNGGDITLGGDVIWPEDRDVWWMPELDLEFDADEARLVRRADVDATIDGTITVTGPWRDLSIEGLLDVSPLIIQLNSLLQSGVPKLNVVRATEAETEAAQVQSSAFAPEGQLQIRLRAERRAQIYGQGLAAELSGEVDITNELSSPEIGGRFQVIRGTYTAFGKNFTIERGNVQIQGSQLLLDILAVYEGPDITVNLNIQGSQDQLSLSLTSTPALANDELLARLLFGRSIAEMSALQAVQLAAALNSLRNPGGGLDVFGTTRDLLGLDALTLDSGTNEEGESGVNVQAGKYLSDRIYLEVESGVGAKGLEGSLQFQLTPRINAELYTRGQFGAGGVELNWKNDY